MTWAAEQQRRREEANRARSEKAASRPRKEDGTFEGTSSGSSNEDRLGKRDNRTVTELAKEAGVSRPTMEGQP